MNTLKPSLELMKQNGAGIAKIIGIQLLASTVYIPIFIVAIFFPPIFLVFPFFTVFYGIFHIQAYRIWFLENHHATIGELFQASFESFKKNGLRYFGVSFLIGFLVLLLLMLFLFGMFGTLLLGDSFNPVAFVMSNLVTLMVFSLLSLLIMYFPQYLCAFVALGVPKATKQTFANWKNIMLCGLIFIGLQFIPFLGLLVSFIFNFVMPLKIILDSGIVTNQTIGYEQPYSYSDEF